MLGVFAYLTREWRLLLWVIYAPCIIFISYFWCLPESTRWLATKGKIQEVRRNVLKAGKFNGTEFSETALKMLRLDAEEFMELQPKGKGKIEEAVVTETKTGYPIWKAIRNRTIFLRLLIMSFCWATNTFVYYGLSIYSVTFAGDKYVNYIAGSLIELPSIVITYLLVNSKWLGRKRSLILTLFISGIACFCQLLLDSEEAAATVIAPGPFSLFLIGKCAITVSISMK